MERVSAASLETLLKRKCVRMMEGEGWRFAQHIWNKFPGVEEKVSGDHFERKRIKMEATCKSNILQ